MFPVLIHVLSFWIKMQTTELVPYNDVIQKFVSLSFILQQMFQADPDVSYLLFVNSTLWHPYSRKLLTPQNLCDDVIHTFHIEAKVFTDTLKRYMTITLHHLIHFRTCVWVHNMGWTSGACHILSLAPTLFERLAPVKHCCMLHSHCCIHVSYENKCLLVLYLLHTETG